MRLSRAAHYARAAVSRGAGYEPTPRGGRFRADAVAGYYVDFSAKTRASTASTPESLAPAALAQLALGWWELALEGRTGALDEFMHTCRQLEGRAVQSDRAAIWRYDVPIAKYELSSTWSSAMAQGQAASVFVRALESTGDARYADLARAAVEPLLDVARSHGLVVRVPEGTILEECPTRPPSAILNGWIYAAWGIRDVAVGLSWQRAHDACDETIACLRELLPRYDAGWWSRYSLYPHRVPDLAKLFYHRLHVTQLTMLEQATGDSTFGEVARRWRCYDTPLHRARLLVQKAAFVASGYR